MKEYIEQKVDEFEKSYEGILPPDAIKRGSDWYRTSLTEAYNKGREEAFNDPRISRETKQELSNLHAIDEQNKVNLINSLKP